MKIPFNRLAWCKLENSYVNSDAEGERERVVSALLGIQNIIEYVMVGALYEHGSRNSL